MIVRAIERKTGMEQEVEIFDACDRLVNFDYKGQGLSVVQADGRPWYIASDLARIVGIDLSDDRYRYVEPLCADRQRYLQLGGTQHKLLTDDGLLGTLAVAWQFRRGRRRKEVHAIIKWWTDEVAAVLRAENFYGGPRWAKEGPTPDCSSLVEMRASTLAHLEYCSSVGARNAFYDSYVWICRELNMEPRPLSDFELAPKLEQFQIQNVAVALSGFMLEALSGGRHAS